MSFIHHTLINIEYCIFQNICVNTYSWDFKSYPVSVFSYRLLDQMYTYPLFYVPDLNPALYINNKMLLSALKKRVHLRFVNDFVKTCRFAVRCVDSLWRVLKLNNCVSSFIESKFTSKAYQSTLQTIQIFGHCQISLMCETKACNTQSMNSLKSANNIFLIVWCVTTF